MSSLSLRSPTTWVTTLQLSVKSSTYFVSRNLGHLFIVQSQGQVKSMWRMAKEQTEPAMIPAYVVTGCDTDPHKPTPRWKLNSIRMTLRSGKTPVAASSPDVPEPDLLKALYHVQERRGPALAWFVFLHFFQHQVLPCCHFG